VTPNKLKTLLNFWAIKNWIKRKPLEYSKNHVQVVLTQVKSTLQEKMEQRHQLAKMILEALYRKATEVNPEGEEVLIEFSVQELREAVQNAGGLYQIQATNEDIEDTLFYLSRIEAIKIEGGFLVVYNRITLNRVEKNNKIQYKQEDYQKLAQFYQNKVQQIHIVGEYARKMIDNYREALQFVDDYFQLNYTSFLHKYFPGSRQEEIRRTLTPAKFRQLFGALSPAQLEVIRDAKNQHIVVAAGPGSGKTRVLVHKLASLLLTEDIKHEQLLMLTFSRAAATEFKRRLLDLIGNAAHYVEIKTFHSYCFDLVGRVGNLDQSDSILQTAVEKIRSGDIEPSRVTKAVLVVDEAQDMNEQEFALVQTLLDQNEEMRVVLVGDDDQNIYRFRGADSRFMQTLITTNGAKKYELVENYRSKANIVSVANQWAAGLQHRLKTLPIVAHDSNNGRIQFVSYGRTNLITPFLEHFIAMDLVGTTCVLTRTNDEAMQVKGMLVKHGYVAQLIQSNEGFALSNLQELRFFTELICAHGDSPVVEDEAWESGKLALQQRFKNSAKLDWCRVLIKIFEGANSARKYKSDWTAFLQESRFEDFVQIRGETIYVSTIHKAKGKEFDNVFILLDQFDGNDEDCKRQLYVGMTRAKSTLIIHYTGGFLNTLVADQLTATVDKGVYPVPRVLSHLLTHRDVKLGYFEYVQHRMADLYSGVPLIVSPDGLSTEKGLVVKFSNEFTKTLVHFEEKGYSLRSAKVNFVVYWYNSKENKEVKIVLPELAFEM
jgi:ATP-dependent DNA helicase RecQ